MMDSEDRTVVGRLKCLSQIEPSRESTELALNRARAALTTLPAATEGRRPEPFRQSNRITQWIGGFTTRQRIAVLGSIGVAAMLGLFLLYGGITATPVSAMEQMAENVRKAKSYKCTQINEYTYTTENSRSREVHGKSTRTIFWLASDTNDGFCSKRSDGAPASWPGPGPQGTQIRPAGKPGITILHRTKTFLRSPAFPKPVPSSSLDDLESLGRFSRKADRELGTKEINGKKAHGFQIDMNKMDPDYSLPGLAEIWIDAESNLPVLVRYEQKWLGISMTLQMTDIQWNIDLDAKLFDPTPPEGYADATPKPPTLEEQANQISGALKVYAEASRGSYPHERAFDSSVIVYNLCQMLGLARRPTSNEDKDRTRLAKAEAGFDQIRTLEVYNAGFAYYGKTVGPNDKDKVLLRWKLDDGRYEVIFGDLRSETVTAKRLRELEGW